MIATVVFWQLKDTLITNEKKNTSNLHHQLSILTNNKKIDYKRIPSSEKFEKLAQDSYDKFLNKNNPYHIQLSYLIQYKTKKFNSLVELNTIESNLRQYEISHSLKYEKELEVILRNGHFETHLEVEQYLIETLSLTIPDEIINIIEKKLNNTIVMLNSNDSLETKYFEFILSQYLDKINHANIDIFERRKLLDKLIVSSKIKLIVEDQFNAFGTKSFEINPVQDNQEIELESIVGKGPVKHSFYGQSEGR